jgi:polyketide cyclase/dehydrase/lipid transport protein
MPSITVPTSPEDTFDFLASLGNHEPFCDHFMSRFRVSGAPSGVGSRIDVLVHAPGRRVATTIEVVHAERPRLIVERATSGGGRRVSESAWTLTPAPDGGTGVDFSVRSTQVPRLERPLLPLANAWVARQNDRALQRLAALLAERAAAGGVRTGGG